MLNVVSISSTRCCSACREGWLGRLFLFLALLMVVVSDFALFFFPISSFFSFFVMKNSPEAIAISSFLGSYSGGNGVYSFFFDFDFFSCRVLRLLTFYFLNWGKKRSQISSFRSGLLASSFFIIISLMA